MNYVLFEAGGKEYKLRLSTRALINLEKTIGCNPLSIFGTGDTLPTITVMIAILHNSLTQLNHGITKEDAYGIWDAYLADGHTMTDFLGVIVDIYRVSGLMKAEETEKN